MRASFCLFLFPLFIFGCGAVPVASATESVVNEAFITGEVAKIPASDAKELGIKVEVEKNTESVSTVSLLLSSDLSESVKRGDVEISGNVFSLAGELIVSTPPISKSADFNVKKGLIFRISFVSKRDIGVYKAGTTYLFDLIDY
ncbi:hypothetical protein ACJJIP_13840 [Microbulbifer sp. VTAC004]|uniref:hypothetical protein n=1 Tax=unclassified Microbulbifer TaxID=2619833 RepID=UPI00403A511B